MRPELVVVVTGTGTEVGKTWVTCRLVHHLRSQGHRVVARKPAQSFVAGTGPTDAERLAAATGEDPAAVCPAHRSYPLAMAPPMAAAALGRRPPTLAELAAEVDRSWPREPGPLATVGLVEGAGGVAAPQAEDGDTNDLAAALGADVVILVGDAGLGTINLVRLSRRALAGHRCIVHLNRYRPEDLLHRGNVAWLAEHDGMQVSTDVADLGARLLAIR